MHVFTGLSTVAKSYIDDRNGYVRFYDHYALCLICQNTHYLESASFHECLFGPIRKLRYTLAKRAPVEKSFFVGYSPYLV